METWMYLCSERLDMVWALLLQLCFTPQTGQPGRLKTALRDLTLVALEAQV